MDYDYNKPRYLLPTGCKDLNDVGEPKTVTTQVCFVVTVQLPELRKEDLEITVERNTMRIITKHLGNHVIEVPKDYTPAKAHASYMGGLLRILVPKAAA
jgi:HSP20 family molecular chaperone IbpA